jgi:hypothetical protein
VEFGSSAKEEKKRMERREEDCGRLKVEDVGGGSEVIKRFRNLIYS